MEIKYNLRTQSKIAFSLILGLLAFIVVGLIAAKFLLFSADEQINDIFFQIVLFATLGSAATSALAYYLLKDTKLIINKEGVTSTSKLMNLHPQFSPLNFRQDIQIYKVADCGKTMLGNIAKLDNSLKQNDTLIAFVDREKTPKKVFMMSNNVWEVEDIALLEQQLKQIGLDIKTMNVKAFIDEFIPQMADLGKKAGYIAYGCLIPIAIAFVIFSFFDQWSTIYYGGFTHLLWVVFFTTLMLSLWYIKTNIKQMIAHIMVAGLFGLSMVFLIVVSVTAITPTLGDDLPLAFKYTETNKFKEETWTAIENPKLKIYCKTDHRNNDVIVKPDIQKTTAKKWFSIIRVDGKKTLCPHGRYLSDAMLPHE